MRDTFNDWKRSKNSKRAANRRDGLALIRSLGVDFLCKNGGAHLIVWPNSEMRVDYWPGTGLWRQTHRNDYAGRGIGSLLAYIEREKLREHEDLMATARLVRELADDPNT